MTLAQMLQRRAALVAEMTETRREAGESWTDEQRTRFDAAEAAVTALDGDIARQRRLDELDRALPPAQRSTPEGDYETQCRERFSLRRAIAAAAGIEGIDTGLERELSQECVRRSARHFMGFAVPFEVLQTRVMVSAGNSGIIPTDHLAGQYIDRLHNALITQQLGATVLRGLSGDVSIPKNNSSDTAVWFSENNALTAANKSFTSVTMEPHHVGLVTEYSRNLLLQTSPDIETLLRNDFTQELAVALDDAAIKGSGSGSEPAGIINTAGVNTPTTTDHSWDMLQEMIKDVEAANATMTGWAISPLARYNYATTPRQVGGVEGAFIMPDPATLAGYPARKSQMMMQDGSPSGEVTIAGMWSSLLIGMWSGIDLLANPYETTAYLKGNIQLRGIVTADIAVRRPTDFSVAM
jgi:HK97 family phage major capsid protein